MTEVENDLLWESYLYPGTETLINNYDIRDKEKLKEVEANDSFEKLLELSNNPILTNDLIQSLKNIHKYTFDSIYPFAGEYRKVNMGKRIGTFLLINNKEDIERYLNELFNEIDNLLKICNNSSSFADILAKMYTGLIYCHPFREGNGRTIREFTREFSILKSRELGLGDLELDWRLINKKELNQNIELAHIFQGYIPIIFKNALVTKENINKR